MKSPANVPVDIQEVPTASNGCGDYVYGVADTSFPISTPGLTTITWTYNDMNGYSDHTNTGCGDQYD